MPLQCCVLGLLEHKRKAFPWEKAFIFFLSSGRQAVTKKHKKINFTQAGSLSVWLFPFLGLSSSPESQQTLLQANNKPRDLHQSLCPAQGLFPNRLLFHSNQDADSWTNCLSSSHLPQLCVLDHTATSKHHGLLCKAERVGLK